MVRLWRLIAYRVLVWLAPDEERHERRKIEKQARRDFYREEAQ